MYIRKWTIIISLISCIFVVGAIFAVKTAAAVSNIRSLDLFFAGRHISSGIQVIEKNGSLFINLPFLSKFFNIITARNIEHNDVFLKFGKMNIKFYAGNLTYYVNGESRRLNTAPFEKEGQFWLPLQFIQRLGIVIKNQNQHQLILDWEKNYLLNIENITYQGRPAFLFIGTPGMKISDSSINNDPSRLILEFPETEAHFSLDLKNKNNVILQQLRFEQNPNGLKLIGDLTQPAGYKLVRDPNQPNQLIMVFNYFLKEIALQPGTNDRQIIIKSSSPAIYQLEPVISRDRLIIDFADATLATENQLENGDGKWIKSVKINQFDSQTVRMEINFISSNRYFVIRSPEDPGIIKIRTIQLLNQLSWDDSRPNSRLILDADGEIIANIQKVSNPEQLWVDLKYLQLPPQLKLPVIKSDKVAGVHLAGINPETTRIVIDLPKYIDYYPEISSDHRRLAINFRFSPLIGKTVVLDPGHGGEDLGACGRQGFQEKDNNLEIAMHLKDLLEQAGAAVILTRTDDYFVSLYERAFLANSLLADLFVSIHTNNHPDLNVHGIEVYHFPGHNEAKKLAQDVLAKLVLHSGFTGLGVKQDEFVVIRETQMPGILAEVGYLSNFEEEKIMNTPEFKNKAALGIFQGIMDYYNK